MRARLLIWLCTNDIYLYNPLQHSDGSAVVSLVICSVSLLLQLLQLIRFHQLVLSLLIVWGALQLKQHAGVSFNDVLLRHIGPINRMTLSLPLLHSPPWPHACCLASTGCSLSAAGPIKNTETRRRCRRVTEHGHKNAESHNSVTITDDLQPGSQI